MSVLFTSTDFIDMFKHLDQNDLEFKIILCHHVAYMGHLLQTCRKPDLPAIRSDSTKLLHGLTVQFILVPDHTQQLHSHGLQHCKSEIKPEL